MNETEEHGVVTGRVHRDLIVIKTARGDTTTVRVLPELGARLDLGQRTRLRFDERGRLTAVAPVNAGAS